MTSLPVLSPSVGNRLLARLSPEEYDRLSASLELVALKPKHILNNVLSPITHVYFPISGIISAMTVMGDGRAIEVATIGSEGVAGLNAFVGGETSPYEVMVQVPGEALRLKVEIFKKESSVEGRLRQILVHYNTAFTMQLSYAIACNGLHNIERRCCRWLLMTQDRVGADVLNLTHEFLAIMLGVRRASVTDVLRPLQKRGLIHNERGEIRIVDRPGLEALACECYSAVNQEFVRLFG